MIITKKKDFDELYENVIVRGLLMRGLFGIFQKVDAGGVDGAVNGVAAGVQGGGLVLRRAQTGQLQLYGLVIGAGLAVIIIAVYLFR